MTEVPNIKVSKGLIAKLREAGLLDEIALRNLYIKKQFLKRCKKYKKQTKKQIIKTIAEELGMEPDTVDNIIYQKLTRKKPLLIQIDEIT